jgi:mono/diheme cytochrome c family protein
MSVDRPAQAPEVHVQQRREHAEPQEAANPVPWIVIMLTAVLLAFGVVYIARSTLDRPSAWGDGRTAPELQAQESAAAGGVADGAAVYAARCAACHQPAGTGVPGVFPPLAGSEWANGKETTVVAIVLHGITGPLTVAGHRYDGTMPTFREQLSDGEIAALLTHVRSQWGNQAAPVAAQGVAAVRKATAARSAPFNGEAELASLP